MNAMVDFKFQHRLNNSSPPFVGVLSTFVQQASERVNRSRDCWSDLVQDNVVQQKVNEALTLVDAQRAAFSDLADMAMRLAEVLKSSDPATSDFVDPNLTLCDSATAARELIVSSFPDLVSARRSVDADRRLSVAQRAKLASVFDKAIAAVKRADKGFRAMIDAVNSHDEAVADMRGSQGECAEEIVRRVHGADAVELMSQMRDAEGNAAFTLARAREAFLKHR